MEVRLFICHNVYKEKNDENKKITHWYLFITNIVR